MSVADESFQVPSFEIVRDLTRGVGQGLAEESNLPNFDPTRSNQCHLLTLYVMNALNKQGFGQISRELHLDPNSGDWHYILAYRPLGELPGDNDNISDLNPWQWREFGGSVLHGPRGEVMRALTDAGASSEFAALRGLSTLVEAHDLRTNPFSRK